MLSKIVLYVFLLKELFVELQKAQVFTWVKIKLSKIRVATEIKLLALSKRPGVDRGEVVIGKVKAVALSKG